MVKIRIKMIYGRNTFIVYGTFFQGRYKNFTNKNFTDLSK